MSLKTLLEKELLSALKVIFSAQQWEDTELLVEYPEFQFGDISTPLAMRLAKELKMPPIEIATAIKDYLSAKSIFTSVSVAGPGFLNFKLKQQYYFDSICEIINKEDYGSSTKRNDKTLLLEYVSANPTGPLHIGHGRWAAIGSALAKILKYRGFEVFQEFYINDTGNQIYNLKKTVECIRNHQPIPEEGYHGDQMKVFENNDQNPVDYFLAEQQTVLKKFCTHFDNYFKESSLHDKGIVKDLIEKLKSEKMAYKKDEALWFNSSAYGDDKDRVLIKSDGSYTYFAVDVAYHYQKIKRNYQNLINVFGADHHGYVQRISAAVNILSKGKTKLDVIIGQLVSLFRDKIPVKMSKRTGDIITLEEVIDEIGVDATRYYLTMRPANTPLEFDLSVAKSKTGDNPVFYVQYAHARISSLFEKIKEKNISIQPLDSVDFNLIMSDEMRQIVIHLMKFPEELQSIANSYEIHHLNNYLFDLAGLFHHYYFENKFIDANNIKKTQGYYYFLLAIQRVLRNGLSLLSIEPADDM